jgi:signal-transduction protein with cAMP-binding, CBS, and nucleotidyltransferase domain
MITDHHGTTIAHSMTRRVIALSPGATAFEARWTGEHERMNHLLVMEGLDLVGIVCSCDLLSARPSDRISWLMSRRVITAEDHRSVESIATLMRHTGVGCVPIVRNGRVFGVVTRGDLYRAGVPFELTGPVCSSCGSHHHVRPSIGLSELKLCSDCSDRAHPPAKLERDLIDLGVGD